MGRNIKINNLHIKETLLVSLHACVYIYIWQLSSFRAPKLWFIDLTVATCCIQYTFLSLCLFFHEKTNKSCKYSMLTVGINTESLFKFMQPQVPLTGRYLYNFEISRHAYRAESEPANVPNLCQTVAFQNQSLLLCRLSRPTLLSIYRVVFHIPSLL